ncbi:MAG: amino acid ABC transporter substrate-binding protein [Deltaproteobacteria bacterium]|nr:amino acid ABC transporter substrate-binding protein [Deltaproteobacteria bacterium]
MERLKIYWLVALVAAVVVAGFGIGTVGAADHLSVIKQRGEIIVGTSADYPPYESVDKKGNFVGFDMDIIREVGKRMGLKVKIKDMGFDTLIAALQKKKIDLIIAAMQGTPERDEKVDFSIPYNFVKDAFITSTKADVKMTKALDAAGKKIGVQTGTIQETWVMNNLVKPGLTREDQLFRYERVDNAGLDLAAGRIDLVLIQSKPAKDLVAKNKKLKIALVTTETIKAGQCIALPEGETSLKAELDRIITQLKKEGWIKRKKAQWGID